jgi:hypothetical protein
MSDWNMKATIQPLPSHWQAGATHQVVVQISGAPAGQSVSVEFFGTLPIPEKVLGQKSANVDGSGSALVSLSIILTDLGINVVHIEATQAGNFDSDSSGTIVQ